MLVLAAIALLVGVVVGASHVPAERKIAQQFAQDWDRGDYGSMYDLIAADVKRRVTPLQFASAYRAAAATATGTGVRTGKVPDPEGGVVRLPVAVRTRIWGTLPGVVSLPFSGDGDDARVDWRPNLVFPGLDPGRHLTRNTALGQRGDILARNGQPLVSGAGRAVAFPEAQSLAGEMGKPGPVQRHALRPLGYPPDARVGTSGLELALNRQLAGQPGGVLRAGGHTIAKSTPKAGANVRTTIDPSAQKAAAAALGDRLGGATAITPDGEILAMAGIAGSDLQPPGSTFKMITLTGGARGQRGQAVDRLPLPDRHPPRGRPPRERQRRVVRRHAGAVVRELVQLGLRPARGQDRGPEARLHGRALRLQPAARRPRHRREHAAPGQQGGR